jgi:hypothetical protein
VLVAHRRDGGLLDAAWWMRREQPLVHWTPTSSIPPCGSMMIRSLGE